MGGVAVHRRTRGFTLIEIAITIAIVGLLTAGIVALLTTFLKSTRARIANDNAAVVLQSLQRFVDRYGRLPCPANRTLNPGTPGYGVEDTPGVAVGASCQAAAVKVGTTQMARGVVPWITLGLSIEQVQDGYSRMLSYHVTEGATLTTNTTRSIGTVQGNMTIHTATPTILGLPSSGGNQINSCWVGPGTPVGGENSCNMSAVVVLISHGENGLGGYTSFGNQVGAPTAAAEIENTDANVGFVKGDPTAAGFDDVVYFWGPDELLDPLYKQGTVKSATAIANEQIQQLSQRAASLTYTSCTIPDAATLMPTAAVDPWNTNISYSRLATGNPCLALNQPAFEVRSLGMDRQSSCAAPPCATQTPFANTGRVDDVWVVVTTDTLCAQVINKAPACP